jgi:hypothetical protein
MQALPQDEAASCPAPADEFSPPDAINLFFGIRPKNNLLANGMDEILLTAPSPAIQDHIPGLLEVSGSSLSSYSSYVVASNADSADSIENARSISGSQKSNSSNCCLDEDAANMEKHDNFMDDQVLVSGKRYQRPDSTIDSENEIVNSEKNSRLKGSNLSLNGAEYLDDNEKSPSSQKDSSGDSHLDSVEENQLPSSAVLNLQQPLSLLSDEELLASIPTNILESIHSEEECARIFKNSKITRRNLLESAYMDERMRQYRNSQEKQKEEEKNFLNLLNSCSKDIRKLFFEKLVEANRLGEPYHSSDLEILNEVIENSNTLELDVHSPEPHEPNPVEPPRHAKMVNPKMLILDFAVNDPGNIRLVHNVLRDFTQIRKFSLKILPKGGVSILFPSEQSKRIASDILKEKLGTKLKYRGFMNNKNLFEVISFVPNYIDREELKHHINADRFIERFGNRVVFFMKSLKSAKELVENGLLFQDFFLTFEIFVFRPKIGCRNCGSFDHSSCEAKDTKVDSALSFCRHCFSTEHSSFKCQTYIETLKEATAKKRKSYAEAIQAPSKSITSKKIGGRLCLSEDKMNPKMKSLAPENFSQVHSSSNILEDVPITLISTIVSAVLVILKVSTNPEEITSAIVSSFNALKIKNKSTNRLAEETTTPALDNETWPSLNCSHEDNNPLLSSNLINDTDSLPLSTKKNKSKAQNPSNDSDSSTKTSKYSLTTSKQAGSIDSGIPLGHIAENAEKRKSKGPDKSARYSKAVQEKSNQMQGIETTPLSTIEGEDEDASMGTGISTTKPGSAKCTCGHNYKIGSGTKAHFSRKKPCSEDPKFVCSCGSQFLSLDNWGSNYGKFNKHLLNDCVSVQIENSTENDC